MLNGLTLLMKAARQIVGILMSQKRQSGEKCGRGLLFVESPLSVGADIHLTVKRQKNHDPWQLEATICKSGDSSKNGETLKTEFPHGEGFSVCDCFDYLAEQVAVMLTCMNNGEVSHEVHTRKFTGDTEQGCTLSVKINL